MQAAGRGRQPDDTSTLRAARLRLVLKKYLFNGAVSTLI